MKAVIGFAFTRRICLHLRIVLFRSSGLSEIRQGQAVVKAVKAINRVKASSIHCLHPEMPINRGVLEAW